MKRMGWLLTLVSLAGLLFSQVNEGKGTQHGVLIVTVNGFENSNGQVRVYLFDDPKAFPSKKDQAVKIAKEPIHDQRAEIIFDDIPYGTYAVSVHHDANGNDKLDHNWMYMPTEPYGASNGARSRFSAPKFNKAKFELNADTVRVTVTVK
jgi:uncharacterized protein (DUF2141 family)